MNATRSHLVLITGLGLGLAFPVAALPAPTSASRVRDVVVAPLFDAQTRFRVKKTVELRFRAREAVSGVPVRPQDISFSPLAQFATSCHILPHLTTFSPPLASRSSALHCAISRYVARTVSAVPQSDLAADNPSSELIEFSSPSLTLLQTHQVSA